MTEQVSAGDRISEGSEVIKIHLDELRQIFNVIDPSPFHERDLDPRAEEFIVAWAKDLPKHVPLALAVHVERVDTAAEKAAILREAVHQFFSRRASDCRRRLRELFRRGRISLLIGLAFLASSLALGDLIANFLQGSRLGGLLSESFLIGGWVAMWRPLEVFLYDWWPIRAEARLFDRLSVMPVQILYSKTGNG